MTTTADGTDMGTGFAALFFLLAAGASAVMLVGEGLVTAFGFGAAVFFGLLLVVSLHVYE